MRHYGKACGRRLTPFKSGYLAGLGGHGEMHHLYFGRRRADYERGYCCGLYWETIYSMLNRS